jgi:hypothetical protein
MPARLATCSDAGILLGLFDSEDGGDMFLRNRLHGVISQKILFNGERIPETRKWTCLLVK